MKETPIAALIGIAETSVVRGTIREWVLLCLDVMGRGSGTALSRLRCVAQELVRRSLGAEVRGRYVEERVKEIGRWSFALILAKGEWGSAPI